MNFPLLSEIGPTSSPFHTAEKRKDLQKIFLTDYDERMDTLMYVQDSLQALSEIIDDGTVTNGLTLSGSARTGLAHIFELLAKEHAEAWGNLPSEKQIREMFEGTEEGVRHE